MSTKVSIRARSATPTEPGFHLYWDCLDEMAAADDGNLPVYLRLEGVPVELHTLPTGGASVTITRPRELATRLIDSCYER